MKLSSFIATVLICMGLACSNPVPEINTLSEKEKAEGWQLLFDGKTTNGWHMFSKPEMKHSWKAVNGELTTASSDTTGTHGDIVTDAVYENYELVWVS